MLRTTDKITALYCKLSVEDAKEKDGKDDPSNSIQHQQIMLMEYAQSRRFPNPTFYLFVGFVVLYFFVAMIGVHIGLQYENTRSAAATSLGVVFFLFFGVSVCIWTLLAFSGSFEAQLQPFLAFMLGGGIGLYVALGAHNPSKAIALASFALPPRPSMRPQASCSASRYSSSSPSSRRTSSRLSQC